MPWGCSQPWGPKLGTVLGYPRRPLIKLGTTGQLRLTAQKGCKTVVLHPVGRAWCNVYVLSSVVLLQNTYSLHMAQLGNLKKLCLPPQKSNCPQWIWLLSISKPSPLHFSFISLLFICPNLAQLFGGNFCFELSHCCLEVKIVFWSWVCCLVCGAEFSSWKLLMAHIARNLIWKLD